MVQIFRNIGQRTQIYSLIFGETYPSIESYEKYDNAINLRGPIDFYVTFSFIIMWTNFNWYWLLIQYIEICRRPEKSSSLLVQGRIISWIFNLVQSNVWWYARYTILNKLLALHFERIKCGYNKNLREKHVHPIHYSKLLK